MDQVAAGKFSDLICYLRRPPELHHLKYTEMYEQYTVKRQQPATQAALTVNVNGCILYYSRRRHHVFVR